ncbi:MAG: GTPase/DUF3482 domain-containing protein [Ottowia sp.]|nr:GTPase/DUF3482 domain-containing protein [Ottowia sp.]
MPEPNQPLSIAVVGHTNAGKTSLLRTLTRDVKFGEVSSRPGTTRASQLAELRLDGRCALRFIDTPGLEDSVALLEYLHDLPGATRPERVAAFLAGPEARASFEQEAKVLRALSEMADAAMYVIDTREAPLPKHRAEIDILSGCGCPVMPVLNFMRSDESRSAQWHETLREGGLHARVEFDVVAPFIGGEQQLYGDLATLLPAQRERLNVVMQALARQEEQRRSSACRVIAGALIDVAAMRRTLSSDEWNDEAQRAAFVRDFRGQVQARSRRAADELLAVYAFGADDAELAELPELSGRWEDDLFNPELLKQAGQRMGKGAVVGAALGAVVDVALAGLSLGTAASTGAVIGGVLSGGWRSAVRKIAGRLQGVQELTVEDAVLALLAQRLLALTAALAQRGHAAQEKVPTLHDAHEGERLRLDDLSDARAHPEWESGRRGSFTSGDARRALENALVRELVAALEQRLQSAQKSQRAG